MPKVLNRKDPNWRSVPGESVYVGRPSRWGNIPMLANTLRERERVIRAFENRCREDAEFREEIRRHLRGKNLVCWCAPLPCHADTLLRIANDDDED